MSNSVVAKYIWNSPTALLSSELFYKYEFRHSYRRYIGWAFIAMAQFGVVGALKHDAYGMLIVSSFLLLYWYGVRWQLRKRLAKRLFQASPLRDSEIQTQFDQVGMTTNAVCTPWSAVYKVVALQQGYLFYSALQSNFFPKTAFSSSDERELLRTLLVNAQVVYEKEN